MSALHAGGGAKSWLATFAIGLSTFTVVTAEMLPVGLLTPIVNTLNATIGRAGLLISLPALFAALFAPLVVLGARRTDRRSLLAGFLLLLIAANLLAAATTSLALLFAARILLGFASAVSGPSPAGWRNVWCRRPPSDWRCPSSSAA
ncbi:MFS transporter [Serratia marcescens]|uniref:MFS transporter n=1 Tax=Serratia marcescens TaxID=615 RepID=UPI0022383D35|nr:MFS transporter [Serratia marcescens]